MSIHCRHDAAGIARVLAELPPTVDFTIVLSSNDAAAPFGHALLHPLHPCELAPRIERELARIAREGSPLSWAV